MATLEGIFLCRKANNIISLFVIVQVFCHILFLWICKVLKSQEEIEKLGNNLEISLTKDLLFFFFNICSMKENHKVVPSHSLLTSEKEMNMFGHKP